MTDQPLVSIGMPVRNGAEYLEATIRSLLLQDYPHFELIISDNASSDGTQEICQQLAGGDPRIRYLRQAADTGMGSNWNFVREQAAGEYFMWAAHDDEWSSNAVSASLKALREEPAAVVAFPTNHFINDRRESVVDCSRLPDLAGPLPLLQRLDHVLWFEEGAQKGNLVHGLMRMSALQRIGFPVLDYPGFGEWGGDQLIVFKMAFHGYFVHVPEAQFLKRYAPSRRYDSADFVEHFREMQAYFSRHRQIINESPLDELARGALIASLSARETTWMCRVLNAKTTDELRGRLRLIEEYCDEQQSGQTMHTVPAEVAGDPLTSIVILNHNGSAHLQECLKSIERHTHHPHEVIVFDNASTDGSRDFLRSLSNIVLVESPVNLGCPPGRAQAISLARGECVVLLDNDTIVTPGWLTHMLQHLSANPNVGILGPRSNHVSGAQLVKSVSYSNVYELEQFAKLWAWLAGRQNPLVSVHRLVGFCMVTRRSVIDRIGGFDARYGKFGFEDDDFTLRAIVAGYEAMIANDVFIHHTGGPQTKGDLEYNRRMAEAWDAFKLKWRIPAETQLGERYDVKQICSGPFDPARHYVPIPDPQTVQQLVYRRHGQPLSWQHSTHPHAAFAADSAPPGGPGGDTAALASPRLSAKTPENRI